MNFHAIPNNLFNPTHPIKVCLIGAGGTGSLVLTRLARLNHALIQCGKQGLQVTVYDDDTVEEYNIGRQMFTHTDVGESKSFALVGKINRNFQTTWTDKSENFDPLNLEDHFDLFITAVDNAAFRVDFDKSFKQIEDDSVYWMDFGNSRNSGQVVLGSSCGSLPTVVDQFPNIQEQDTLELQGRACSYNDKLLEQSLFINDALATQGCEILRKMFTDASLSIRGCYLNQDRHITRPMYVDKSNVELNAA